MKEVHDPDQFHFVSQHYGVSPFVSIAARWYPNPLEGNSGFYMQLEGELIPNQWSIIKMGDYDKGMKSVIAFPLSMGYNFHVTDAVDIRIAGKVISGTTKLNDAWEGIFTTGIDFAVAYSF